MHIQKSEAWITHELIDELATGLYSMFLWKTFSFNEVNEKQRKKTVYKISLNHNSFSSWTQYVSFSFLLIISNVTISVFVDKICSIVSSSDALTGIHMLLRLIVRDVLMKPKTHCSFFEELRSRKQSWGHSKVITIESHSHLSLCFPCARFFLLYSSYQL